MRRRNFGRMGWGGVHARLRIDPVRRRSFGRVGWGGGEEHAARGVGAAEAQQTSDSRELARIGLAHVDRVGARGAQRPQRAPPAGVEYPRGVAMQARHARHIAVRRVDLTRPGTGADHVTGAAEAPLPTKAKPAAQAKGYVSFSNHNELEEKAKKEGKLRILVNMDPATLKVAGKAFNQRYPFISLHAQEITGTDMVQRNAWVGGKVVEFAIRLPGGKLLPIDSKWAATPGLEALAEGDLEPARRTQLMAQVEKEVERRIREVSQYIDPTCTTPWALAAIPDAAYSVCRSAFAEAHRRHVIIVGYSMALPYVLTLYQLYMQFARTVDMENLQACLMDVDRQLDALEGVLENRIQRAVVMLGNAYSEGKQISSRIRASAQSIQVSERVADGSPAPSLALVAGADESP